MSWNLLAAVPPAAWPLLLCAALAAAGTLYFQNGRLAARLHEQEGLARLYEEKCDRYKAMLESSQQGLIALQGQIRECQDILEQNRRRQRDREAALKAARTRKAADDEVLDEISSQRVMEHIFGSANEIAKPKGKRK